MKKSCWIGEKKRSYQIIILCAFNLDSVICQLSQKAGDKNKIISYCIWCTLQNQRVYIYNTGNHFPSTYYVQDTSLRSYLKIDCIFFRSFRFTKNLRKLYRKFPYTPHLVSPHFWHLSVIWYLCYNKEPILILTIN